MVRSMGAVIAGLLVMMVVVSSIQWMGESWYPSEAARDGDPLAMKRVLSTGAQVMELLSLALGSFLGAGTATTLSVRHKRGVAIAIGVVMLGLVGVKLLLFPHATWVAVLALLIPLPF